MSAFKEYTMMFQLNAKLGGSYSKAFKQAMQELESMQKEIQELSKMQADISAFQKQQAAAEATRKRLEMLMQQYDNIQREMEETGNESADMKNKLLAKQLQIDKTSASLEKQTAKLNEMSSALEEAGINTDDLAHSSEQLAGEIDALKKKEEAAAGKANTFGVRAETAFNAVHEAIVAAGVAAALKEIYEYFSDCSQASMDFESAITGVAKTTDLTDSELATMSDSIKALSTEIPATTDEIAAVAEAAGQLGIQKDALLDFTEIMTMLGTATNMTADEAATALARFANITGMATDNYGRLGSVIVDLGNNFATTESEIVAMGTRLASAGMLPQVTAAYNRVAAAARAALSASGTGTAGSIPGYAVGTQSAAPGFALVGENGPELVYFNGGEQVMTAEETAAMRESMEIQAITFAPQLLEAMHAIQGDGALSASLPGQSSELPPIIIENTFHVEGNVTPETIAALADYGDSLKEVVREAIAEIEEDVSRTMYR